MISLSVIWTGEKLWLSLEFYYLCTIFIWMFYHYPKFPLSKSELDVFLSEAVVPIFLYSWILPPFAKLPKSKIWVLCLLYLLNLFVTISCQFFLSNIYRIPLISFQALIISTYSVSLQIFIGYLSCDRPCAKHWGYNGEQRKMRSMPIHCSEESRH